MLRLLSEEAAEVAFVALHGPDVARDVLARIDQPTPAIAALRQVARTVSLTSIEDITGTTDVPLLSCFRDQRQGMR